METRVSEKAASKVSEPRRHVTPDLCAAVCLQHFSSHESSQGVTYALTVCARKQSRPQNTPSCRLTDHTGTVYVPGGCATSSQSGVQQQPGSAGGPCPPLLCGWTSTTPKCVLTVLSSGALGGMETTGGLEGFLLEEVLFSKTNTEQKRKPTEQVQI